MRCPHCGAANPADARWCGQCYTTFDAPGAAAPDPPAGRAPAAPTPAPERAERAAPPPASPTSAEGEAGEVDARGFRRRGEHLEWRCVACGEFNPLDDAACRVCGTALTARFAEPDPERPPPAWGTALALSAVLPGAGHVLAGRSGTGAARAVLFLVWLVGGLLLLGTAGSAAGLAVAPLLLGAFVVWAGTLVDIANARSDGRELLGGRVLLWLVVGVTVLLLTGAFAGAGGGA